MSSLAVWCLGAALAVRCNTGHLLLVTVKLPFFCVVYRWCLRAPIRHGIAVTAYMLKNPAPWHTLSTSSYQQAVLQSTAHVSCRLAGSANGSIKMWSYGSPAFCDSSEPRLLRQLKKVDPRSGVGSNPHNKIIGLAVSAGGRVLWSVGKAAVSLWSTHSKWG